ncbi:hypothetical protein [Sphingomonas sp. 35-24ZXX]|uniref:hypothetical protein n=1 Tax=Sphingomonas sp. 35-24ZXX TaxID=1545915 RepID=UPI00053BECEE|nr:hypothetical protein [Sphingomonas sp. 35-24ZXX]
MDDIVDLLASRCDDTGFTHAGSDDIDKWTGERGIDLSDFLDEIGFEIADRYRSGELPFAFCDSLVNNLWGLLMDRMGKHGDFRWPDDFHYVYEAFDAGEFHRLPDQSDDPEADFTRPMIAAFLAKKA